MFKTAFMKFGIMLLVSFILLSCTDEKTTEPNTSIDLQSLKNGNYWVYHYNTTQDTLRETVAELVEVEVDGQTRSLYRIAVANLNRYYFNDEEGLHFVKNYGSASGADSLADYSYLLYKYPAEIDDNWFQDFSNNGYTIDDNYVECVSTNTVVECFAGTFNCIVYKVSNTELSDNYNLHYYSTGVGLIQSVLFDIENNTYQTKTLFEYSVLE
jgi:hypothetical protein